MISRIISFIILLIFTFPLLGQECGLSDADQSNWMPKYLEHLSLKNFNSQIVEENNIPIVLHLTARDNGVGRAKVETALKMLCDLNDLYAPTGFKFYLPDDGLNFVDNDGIFSANNLLINQLSMHNEKQDSALNVFIVNSVGNNNVVGLYDSNNDWVILQKSAFVTGNKTLAHEIGHFFSLLHPHLGWDGQAWNADIHGNPSPVIASNGITITEKMDGSNCAIAGDLLCDTPPDYNFGINWTESCDYAGGARDPNNELVNPDERLIMSYFNDNCRQIFSAEQIQMMQLDLVHPARTHLIQNYTPAADTIESTATTIAPSGMVNISNNTVDFEWEEVMGAHYYYIEYDRSPDFNLDPNGIITAQNHASINNSWVSGLDYYWRVFAWNDSYFCSPPSVAQQFSVDIMLVTKDVNNENIIEIFSSNENLNFEYQFNKSLDLDLNIFTINGKLFFSTALTLSSKEESFSLNIPDIPKGIYIVTLNGLFKTSQLVYFP